ncbi:hypothetical protein OG413_43945 [Streptomyces sp. NBC_01433]|uniref:hypothetical protein n=1 Tax=Streptomyces sp. NBC_01433 TaxID=2903864 RepID=UPI002254DA48|nr:hypothetical protein [Streptomyces sp. NBC_01433]MCX4682138.1 hypothetical protein [Streptomyces sp. NBC_01433]
MSYEWPWTVRHVYSDADRGLRPYLRSMHGMLEHYRSAGLIREHLDLPVSTAGDLVGALSGPGPDELLIADLHGDVGPEGAWLGPSSTGTFVLLDSLPARSWSASAVILTNCYGAREQFLRALGRLSTVPVAVAGHFEVAAKRDTTPVALGKALLQHSDAGDAGGAFSAMEVAGHNLRLSSAKAWVPDLIEPADVVRAA